MKKKSHSLILLRRAPIIREMVFCHPSWTNKKYFNKRWGTSRQNTQKLLLGLNDAYVSSLAKIAENLGISFGELLDLGLWHYDPEGLIPRVTALRKKAGLNKRQLSIRCGFSQSFITQMDRDGCRCGLRLSTIEAIAKALGAKVRQILSAC